MKAVLPDGFDNYIFDLYGTLVDIHTDEQDRVLWEKLALFYGYYGAIYSPEELRASYLRLVTDAEAKLKSTLDQDPKYAHESSPEIEISKVFMELYATKGTRCDNTLAVHTGQFFRVLSTDYVKAYPGTKEMLMSLKNKGKKVYLLSNAQRIFTEYEMHTLDIFKYFDAVYISSDYKTKKPDKRFFDTLISEQSIDVKKSIFIGNDSKSDIAGAKQVGLATYYVGSNISPKNDDGSQADYFVEKFTDWQQL